MHPFYAADRPLVFAHRGGAALAPENTMPAFDSAVALGADGLELDVRLSRDGVVVVHHDAALDRTTTLTGPVVDKTSEDLCAAGVPSLADVLARHTGVRVIVELKQNTDELAQAAVDTIERAGAAGRVCIGSFGWRALRPSGSPAPHATAKSRASIEEVPSLDPSSMTRICSG